MARAAAPGVTTAGVNVLCDVPLNVVRTMDLSLPLPLLYADTKLQEDAAAALKTLYAANKTDCPLPTADLGALSLSKDDAFVALAGETANIGTFSCPSIVQNVVNDGLAAIKEYDAAKFSSTGSNSKANFALQVLSHKATKFGCAITTDCNPNGRDGAKRQNILYCKFSPALKEGDFAFPLEVFNGLKARTNLDLKGKSAAYIKLPQPSKALPIYYSGAALAAVSVLLYLH